jgi:hypothetical protein
MDVRVGRHGIDADADGAHDRTLGHGVVARDRSGGQLEQRHRVAVRRLDGDGAPAGGEGADEGDRAGRRSQHGRTDVGPDVDAAMLAARVRVGAEDERPQHGAGHRPGPGGRAGAGGQRQHEGDRDREHALCRDRHRDRLRRWGRERR